MTILGVTKLEIWIDKGGRNGVDMNLNFYARGPYNFISCK